MQRTKVNFIVDAVAFVALVLLTATGVLIRYVLPAGSGRFSALWGMDRHGWGQLHYWFSVVLMAAFGFHLFLHWRWVVNVVKGRPRAGSGPRLALAVVGVTALVGLAAAPFFGRVEQTGEPPRRMRVTAPGETPVPPIDGTMTLKQVEQLTGVPAAVILRELGLPPQLPGDARLGRLSKDHGFELHEVREIVRRRLEER
ncbi:MAG: hypothetical protein A2V67_16575 [Deltaproteobacteria bacterium RBG_13_61_14]|nr:MAG: hypothetical protein A2V67_16575 [Deltaproteobacteria bacterium RBG_13_61_14]